MQTSARHHRHDRGGSAAAERLLLWVLAAAAFVVAGHVVPWLAPEQRAVADLAAAIGAVMLAIPILRNAMADLRGGHVHMDGLVAVAVLAAMANGDVRSAGVIAFLMLISMVIETRTAAGAHRAIESLVRLSPTTARRLDAAGRETEVPAHDLKPGDRVRLLPGDAVPADGRIDVGRTTLNEATITGESLPAEKGPGAEVFAGTQNLTGAVEIIVARAGEDTTLGRVRSLILDAEQTRLPFTRVIDRYAGWYTPLALSLAAIAWFFTDDWDRVVAMLVVACPCALVLATPTAMVAALAAASRAGILIKNVADLEAASRIDAVVFDKTGTLTVGELAVSRLAPRDGVRPSELLGAAAAAESMSQHPAARAIAQLAIETGVEVARPSEARDEAGMGVAAKVGGDEIVVGRSEWLRQRGVAIPEEAAGEEPGRAGSLSLVHVAVGGRYFGWIGLDDQVRPSAREAVRRLRDLCVRRIAMVTGDLEAVARKVAAEVECDEYRAACLPQAKVDYVNGVRGAGFRVAVVGDGVNDAPALAAGDIGIAMGAAGSDIALHSATVALMNNDLGRLPLLLRLSRMARRLMLQNIAIGVVFIAGGMALSGAGRISPIVAALLHNAGSLIVVFNSGRLVRQGGDAGP